MTHNFGNILLIILFIIKSSFPLESKVNQEISKENTFQEENPIDNEKNCSINFKNVLTLTDNNYTELTNNYSVLFINVYSSSCEECFKFLSEYAAAADFAEEKKIKVKFTRINGDKNSNFTEEYLIQKYPTTILLFKGDKYEYKGIKNRYGLLKFLDKKYHGPIEGVKTLKEIEDSQKKMKLVLLSTIRDFSLNIYRSFKLFAEQYDGMDFLECLSDECFKKYGNDITLLKPFDEKINKYSKDFGSLRDNNVLNDSVKTFSSIYAVESGTLLGEDELNMVLDFNKSILFYFRNGSDEKQTKYDYIFKEVGKALRKDNIYTFLAEIEGSLLFQETGEFFVVEKNELPSIVFADFDVSSFEAVTYRKVNVEGNQLSKEFILNYMNDIKDGKIKRDLRSSFPHNQASKDYIGARLVVGRSYDKDVIEEPNNICITFVNRVYFCELCDKYLEVFRTLGHKYKNETNSDVIYAVMDGVENEARDLNFTFDELPLVYLYTNAMENKKVIKFIPKNITEISTDEIEDFVAENLGWNKKKAYDKKAERNKKEDNSKNDL